MGPRIIKTTARVSRVGDSLTHARNSRGSWGSMADVHETRIKVLGH